jgi:hypothetical protein
VAEIRLNQKPAFPAIQREWVFRFRRAETWGLLYDADGCRFTITSHTIAVERAVEVAGAAMELSQVLGDRPGRSYAALFNDINTVEVIEALARTHAASGEPQDALAWARRIGSGGRVLSTDGDEVRRAVERRVYALVGVAEGILDRPVGMSGGPEP